MKNYFNLKIKIFLIRNINYLKLERKNNFNKSFGFCKSLNFNYFSELSKKTGFNEKNIFFKNSLFLYDDYISNYFF